MNLRELEYLVAIEEEQHFHRAAERCFVSQPTLSGQLKKLEDELGVLLVERTNRQVVMTDAGRAIAARARNVLAEVRAIKDNASFFTDPLVGDIHLGIIPTIAPYLLPIIIPALKKHYPGLKFWLYEYQTHQLLEKIQRRELDLLILALPIAPHDYAVLDLFREPFRLAVNKSEQLARQKMINLGDIRKREMLLLEEGHCLRGHVLDACMVADIKESSQFQATSLETLRHMVGEGMGMTLIPELAVPAKTRKTDLIQYIEFSDPKPNRRVGMLYRKKSYREETYMQINEFIRSILPVNIFF